jgi:hypothetical protein
MSKVEIFIDPLKIARQRIDIEVADSADARAARPVIRAHLSSSRAETIRLRMDRQAFRFVKDMDGLDDFHVVHVSARSELASKLHSSLPAWCSDEFIVNYRLIEEFPIDDAFISSITELKILQLINPTLVMSSSPEDLLYAIRNIRHPIRSWVDDEIIKSHFYGIFAQKLEQPEIIKVFEAIRVDNFSSQLDVIFREIVVDKIRAFVLRTSIVFPLQPRQILPSLVTKLRITPDWWDMVDLKIIIISLTQRTIQGIENGSLEPDEVSNIIFGYCEDQLRLIILSINDLPMIATDTLLEVIRNLKRSDTLEIEAAIQAQLQIAPPALLNVDSSGAQAMLWAAPYLEYAINAFRRGNEPNEAISQSFSDWVVAQPTRLLNPQWNWRAVSSAVKIALEKKKIVVLLVVDAFGSILTRRLVDRLRDPKNGFHVEERILFSPLPTITQIAKLAVASGKDVNKLSGDAATSIGMSYRHLLTGTDEYQFIKGWVAGPKIMAPTTRLLVFFENQLDEKLHECLDFSDLDAQLQIVDQKIFKLVKQWMLDAETRGEDIEIFITADHGLTKISTVDEFRPKEGLEVVGERFVKVLNDKGAAPVDFYKIRPEGAPSGCYFIPRRRVRLITKDRPFVHGGATPEEVLIPLISIRPLRIDDGFILKLQLEQPLALLNGNGWTIQLSLFCGSSAVHGISVKASAPFTGQKSVDPLAINETVAFSLDLGVEVPQEGSVSVVFIIRFLTHGATAYSVLQQSVDVRLQPRILLRGQGEIDFDNMFD